jgi:hypothetical protein
MALPVQTVKDFLNDSYQLISASSPTIPLQGNDQSKALQFLNELLAFYSATGALVVTPQELNFTLNIGVQGVTFTDPTVTIPPNPNYPNFNIGRLANAENAYMILDGVTYPLYIESRNLFKSSYKYDSLQGLPRYFIPTYYDDYTEVRFYPAGSQAFQIYVFGKWQLSQLTINGTMAPLPTFSIKFYKIALARELSFYKGRSEAWTDKLEKMYQQAYDDMIAFSPINLEVEGIHEDLLNGNWRVIAGI